MIEQYLRPDSTEKALELMEQNTSLATWFAGGSKLNAAPTKTDKTVAISLENLGFDKVEKCGEAVHIGAMCRIQDLVDDELIPVALKQSARFIYSRHVRNQATLGGEIAALQQEARLLPGLMALKAVVVLVDGREVEVEDYISTEGRELIEKVIIPDVNLTCAVNNVVRSSAGLAVVTAAVSLDKEGKKVIALDGVSPKSNGATKPVRLRDVESQNLDSESLEKAVAEAVYPTADLIGSVEYKRYIAGIVVTDLLAECQKMAEEA